MKQHKARLPNDPHPLAPPLGELSASLTERALSALRAPLPEEEVSLPCVKGAGKNL